MGFWYFPLESMHLLYQKTAKNAVAIGFVNYSVDIIYISKMLAMQLKVSFCPGWKPAWWICAVFCRVFRIQCRPASNIHVEAAKKQLKPCALTAISSALGDALRLNR